MAVVKNAKPRKKVKRKAKPLTTGEARRRRSELVGRVADLVIEQNRDALKELERL